MATPIVDIPAQENVVLYGGRTFDRSWTLKDDAGNPIDLTSFTGSALVKAATTDDDASAVLTFSTSDSSMVLGGAAGTIRLVKSAAATKTFQDAHGHVDTEFRWDLQVTDGDDVSSPILDGTFTLVAMDTR